VTLQRAERDFRCNSDGTSFASGSRQEFPS
jgi:hypothetical protein